ncbi:MAG: hypothetical protein KAG96_02635 [Ichthyobacteriaceae bacterium]|nr:hypothetical protein [Ichthyobacteriaceae bacterium]
MITREMLTVEERSSFLGMHHLDGKSNYIFMASIKIYNHLEQAIILKKGEFNILYLDNSDNESVSTSPKNIQIDPGKTYTLKVGLQLAAETAFAKCKLHLSTLTRSAEVPSVIDLNTTLITSTYNLN